MSSSADSFTVIPSPDDTKASPHYAASPSASPDSDPSTPDELVDDETWTTGDTVLVTHDGVRFRIPSYLLLSSPTLRAKYKASTASPPTITLGNPEYETAATVRQYLSFSTTGELEGLSNGEDYLFFLPLTLFLLQHECTALLRHLLRDVRERHHNKTLEPICVFAVGAVADDPTTLKQALAAQPGSTWSSPSNTGKIGPIPGRYVFDTATWPLALWRAVPAFMAWQLTKAWLQGDIPRLAERFLSEIEEYRAENPSEVSNVRSTKTTAISPKITDDPTWNNGDFELVSADNVRFRVASFDLFSHSGFFRGARQIGGPSSLSVAFTDPEFETASTIRQFLHLVKTGRPPKLEKDADTSKFLPLITFMRKYDCSADLWVMLLNVRDLVRDGTLSPHFGFVIGAAAEDVKTCTISTSILSWTGTTSKTSVFDPSGLGLRRWKSIRPPYLWALTRAWRETGNSAKLSTEFTTLIEAVNRGG